MRLLCALLVLIVTTVLVGISENSLSATGDTWADKASMAIPRGGHAMVTVSDAVYVIGGNSPAVEASVEHYEPTTDD